MLLIKVNHKENGLGIILTPELERKGVVVLSPIKDITEGDVVYFTSLGALSHHEDDLYFIKQDDCKMIERD